MNRIASGLLGVAAVAAFMAPAAAPAAESAAEAARRCAQILGERERLACFDLAFPAGPQTAELANRAQAAAPVVAAAPVAAAPSVPAAPVAAAPSAPSVPNVVAPALGDEQIQQTRRKADSSVESTKPVAPTSLTAQIKALKETRHRVWRLTLDNGQIWQQMDMSNAFDPKVGNTVRIEKGRFGGYTMALVGETRSAWVRTARLE